MEKTIAQEILDLTDNYLYRISKSDRRIVSIDGLVKKISSKMTIDFGKEFIQKTNLKVDFNSYLIAEKMVQYLMSHDINDKEYDNDSYLSETTYKDVILVTAGLEAHIGAYKSEDLVKISKNAAKAYRKLKLNK